MDQLKMRLEELLQLPENSKCADCFESFPTWASTNWGVFICAQCAGVHRLVDIGHVNTYSTATVCKISANSYIV